MAANNKCADGGEAQSPPKPLQISGCPKGQTVTPECEVVFENEYEAGTLETRYRSCKKHPGHLNFISVDKFKVSHLPRELRTDKMVDDIFRRCVLTLRVKVAYTSLDRPNTFADCDAPYPFSDLRGNRRAVRYGTGSIVEVFYSQPVRGKPCPCRLCKESEDPKTLFWWVRARTATHVIHDRSEAEHAEFECFYDSDNNTGVKTIYGIDTFNIMNRYDRMFRHDVCDVLCVTHDHSTVAVFNSIVPANNFLCRPPVSSDYANSQSRIIVSHPHGCSKRITIGKMIHLTVPIGPDYPITTPIPFKGGTIYRQTHDDTHSPRNRHLHNDDKPKDCSLDLHSCIMKENLDAVKYQISQSDQNIILNNVSDICNLAVYNLLDSREKYIVQIYLIFIREHILKILVLAAVVEQKCKKGVDTYEQQVTRAFEEVFRAFLRRDYDTTQKSNTKNEPEASSSSIGLLLHYWEDLLRDSEESFIHFKSSHVKESHDVVKSESVIVAWFHEVEVIMDSLALEMKQKELPLSEDMLPVLINRGLKRGLEILAAHENNTQVENRLGKQLQGIDEDDKMKSKEENVVNSEERCINADGGTAHATKRDAENGAKDKNQSSDVDKDTTGENPIPEGSTFTLPHNADYAFRVYSKSRGWFIFPPGTKITISLEDGTHTQLDAEHFEFQNPSIQPEQCFVTYDTHTCPGSSGANVHCDILGPYLATYFPHSGHLQGAVNRSGIRDNFYTLYTKMFLYQPKNLTPKHQTNSASQSRIFEGSKSLVQTLKDILSKP